MKRKTNYKITSRLPLAKFYYQGNHTHPVRRTVLIIESDVNYITGYELREGNIVRNIEESRRCVKTYRKDLIAKWGDYSRLTQAKKTSDKDPETSTLERFPLSLMFTDGV